VLLRRRLRRLPRGELLLVLRRPSLYWAKNAAHVSGRKNWAHWRSEAGETKLCSPRRENRLTAGRQGSWLLVADYRTMTVSTRKSKLSHRRRHGTRDARNGAAYLLVARGVSRSVHAAEKVRPMLLLRLQRCQRTCLLLTARTCHCPSGRCCCCRCREREAVDAGRKSCHVAESPSRCSVRHAALLLLCRRRELLACTTESACTTENGEVVGREVTPGRAGPWCAWCCAWSSVERCCERGLPCLGRVAREQAGGGGGSCPKTGRRRCAESGKV
jgi:hypothetical protein